MDLGIKGKWALVCGASKGLGKGCAEALADEGVNLVIAARGAEALQATAAELRQRSGAGQVVAVAADVVTDAGREAIWQAQGGPGKAYDIVITNAGGPPPGQFTDWDRSDWVAALEANMLAPIELIKATVQGMAERGFGRIINITSASVKAPIDVLGLSNGARSGLTGFVAGVARSDLAAHGVTINNVLPGAHDTDRLRVTLQGAAKQAGVTYEAIADKRRVLVPMQRFGTAQEFGAVCAFFCGVQAGYVTGQNILVDGGAYPGTH